MENPKLSRSKGRYELKLLSRNSGRDGSFGGDIFALYDKHLKVLGKELHPSNFEDCKKICDRYNKEAEAYDMQIYEFVKGMRK